MEWALGSNVEASRHETILKSTQVAVVAAERGSGEQRGSECHSFCHLVAEGNSRVFLAFSYTVQFIVLLPTAAPCLQLRSYCKHALLLVTRAQIVLFRHFAPHTRFGRQEPTE